MSAVRYRYVALDGRGARVRGELIAPSEHDVARTLRGRGLTPIRFSRTPWTAPKTGASTAVRAKRLAELLAELGMLVGAGASFTAALSMARNQDARPDVARFITRLEQAVAGGAPVASAFAGALGLRGAFVPGLIAAGEASGDLAAALTRAADQIEHDARVIEEFWSALSYPLFIVVAATAAVLVLLIAVVPAIAPLLAEGGGNPPLPLKLMLGASGILLTHGATLLGGITLLLICVLGAGWLGILGGVTDRLLLDGPSRGITRSLVYGRFSGVLGRLLASGVPVSEALRLAGGGVSLRSARDAVERASAKIFEGAPLSDALATCPGVPATIVRMAAVGEASGRLGSMLERAGQVEQATALRKLKALAAVLGPATIIVLGGMIGLIMSGLLLGVSTIGATALQ